VNGWMKFACTLHMTIVLILFYGGKGMAEGSDFANAEKIYRNHCMSCHGVHLEGGAGPILQHVGSIHSKEHIRSIIANGRGSMPPFSRQLDEASIRLLAEWLSTMK
jgi:cytochrome c551